MILISKVFIWLGKCFQQSVDWSKSLPATIKWVRKLLFCANAWYWKH